MAKIPVIVSDSSSLISFEKIVLGFSLLKAIVTTVLVPKMVLSELNIGVPDYIDFVENYNLATVVKPVSLDLPDESYLAHLDDGERYAIYLAWRDKVSIMIEERKGRKAATDLGLKVVGAAGLLLYGVKEDLISVDIYRSAIVDMYAAGRLNEALYEYFLGVMKN